MPNPENIDNQVENEIINFISSLITLSNTSHRLSSAAMLLKVNYIKYLKEIYDNQTNIALEFLIAQLKAIITNAKDEVSSAEFLLEDILQNSKKTKNLIINEGIDFLEKIVVNTNVPASLNPKLMQTGINFNEKSLIIHYGHFNIPETIKDINEKKEKKRQLHKADSSVSKKIKQDEEELIKFNYKTRSSRISNFLVNNHLHFFHDKNKQLNMTEFNYWYTKALESFSAYGLTTEMLLKIISDTPEFGESHYLAIKSKLKITYDIDAALKEVSGLNSVQAHGLNGGLNKNDVLLLNNFAQVEALSALKQYGLTAKHLLDFTQEMNEFGHHHAETLKTLVIINHLDIEDALEKIKGLNSEEVKNIKLNETNNLRKCI